MDTRRILLGDWHPLLRDGIDVLRLALVVGAVVAGSPATPTRWRT
jgi:hypothetical protein